MCGGKGARGCRRVSEPVTVFVSKNVGGVRGYEDVAHVSIQVKLGSVKRSFITACSLTGVRCSAFNSKHVRL
jgi:hypothetical protein